MPTGTRVASYIRMSAAWRNRVAEEAVRLQVAGGLLPELLLVVGLRSSHGSGVIMERSRCSSACSGRGSG